MMMGLFVVVWEDLMLHEGEWEEPACETTGPYAAFCKGELHEHVPLCAPQLTLYLAMSGPIRIRTFYHGHGR